MGQKSLYLATPHAFNNPHIIVSDISLKTMAAPAGDKGAAAPVP